MAEERVIKIVVDKKGADTSVNELNTNLEKTDSSVKGLSSTLDKMSGGAVSAFNSLKSGVSSAVKGFNSLRVAIAATGIGALILAIVAVKQAFTSSEEGQNKFAKIMGVIGSVVGNLTDLLANLGEGIINAFENPKEAMMSFINFFKDNIVTRFTGFLNFIPNIGKAISLVFKGEFKEASKVAADSLGQITLGVESITTNIDQATNALKRFGDELTEDAKKAADIADQRATADKVERNLLVERAKANRDIADLRLKAEKRDEYTAKQRIEFLKEASDIEEDITNKEIYAAQLRYNSKVAENALSKSTKEDLDEEAQLKANLINLETTRLNLNKRLQAQIQTATNEQNAIDKAEAEKKQKALDEEEKLRLEQVEKEANDELERLQKIAEIQDEFRLKREDEEATTALEKLELEKERKLLELEDLEATEQQKADIISYYNDKINAETVKNAAESAEEQKKLEQSVADAKKAIGLRSLDLLAELAGRGSKIGKAIAVTQATISGIEGVQNAYTTAQKSPITALFPAYPYIQAGLAGAFSAIQIKKILSSDSASSSSASSVASSSTATETASAPSFNLVQGTGSNQIAETISSEQKPIEAYVVGSNVTTQQELDRQRVVNSTI